jgi:regulatory protein
MLIHAIRQTSPGRLTVCFEDGSELKSTLSVVTDLRLFSGKDLDTEQLQELRLASGRALAREKALEYLSRRPMSRKELKDKLLQKGEDEDIAEYCVRWLADNGLLDDESYAASVARHYAAKGYGQGRVRTELSRRGINRELWSDAVEQMPDNSSKLDKFIAARLKDPEDKAQVRKVTAALYRRGYSWEDIRSAMSRFNAQVEEEY